VTLIYKKVQLISFPVDKTETCSFSARRFCDYSENIRLSEAESVFYQLFYTYKTKRIYSLHAASKMLAKYVNNDE
jgi:hypothetical protein